MQLSGRLTNVPIGELLTWAHHQRTTGSLVVRRSTREKRLYFQGGRVVASLTDEPAEFYGRLLLLNGHIDERELFRCLTLCRQEGQRLEVVLRKHAILDPELVRRTLRQQIEEVVCDIFLWKHGLFLFQADLPPEEDLVAEPLDAVALALEGARWFDELKRIRRVLPHDHVVLGRGDGWPGVDLPPRQRKLADLVDGERTLGELYEEMKGSYFRFLSASFELHRQEVVQIAAAGQESHTTSLELSLYDLLLEQAAEEQILYSRRHFALPFDLLDGLVPTWVKPLSAEDWSGLPDGSECFLRAFDGERRLSQLFSSDEMERSRQADLLMLQLRDGRLALLPAPLAELDADAAARAIPEEERWWRRLLGPTRTRG